MRRVPGERRERRQQQTPLPSFISEQTRDEEKRKEEKKKEKTKRRRTEQQKDCLSEKLLDEENDLKDEGKLLHLDNPSLGGIVRDGA